MARQQRPSNATVEFFRRVDEARVAAGLTEADLAERVVTAEVDVEAVVIEVGRRIRQRRRELGLSRLSVARRTGLTSAWLTAVEEGRCEPVLDELIALAAALDIAVESFFGGL